MNRTFAVALLLSFAFLGCGSSKKVEDNRPKINLTIMEFVSRGDVKPGEAETVGEMFASSLQQTNRFNVIDRKQITAVMQEQGFQSAQDASGMSKAAGILAVRKMIFGSLGKLGDNYIFTIKMVDVETSSVDLSVSRTYDDDLEDIHKKFLPAVVKEVADAIDKPKK